MDLFRRPVRGTLTKTSTSRGAALLHHGDLSPGVCWVRSEAGEELRIANPVVIDSVNNRFNPPHILTDGGDVSIC